jgi:universal stress protein E
MTPYASILIATDFSDCAEVALGHAVRLSEELHTNLAATHIIDTAYFAQLGEALSSLGTELRFGLEKDAKENWTNLANKLPGAGAASFSVSIHQRASGIIDAAKEASANLIVLGAFGDRRPDVGFGTVATACVRRSPADVLLVRDTQTGPFRRILVGTDFSAASVDAIRRAVEIATVERAELHVVHAFDAPWKKLHFRSPASMVDPESQVKYRATLENRLRDFVAPYVEGVAMQVTLTCVDVQSYRSGLVDHAEAIAADLVVLGTRGTTNLRDMMLGSTAEKVLAETRCSVLAVRPTAVA